ncbi:hypothetical protein B4134_3792 [Bacillus safensis]|nr:hypothetical protein B4134_3792 [Bacillus safensis]
MKKCLIHEGRVSCELHDMMRCMNVKAEKLFFLTYEIL